MVFGPNYSYNGSRIQPVDPDRQDDQRQGGKKKVKFQGRDWAEGEEDLRIEPTIPSQAPSKGASTVYADKALLEKAHALFQKLTTVEEKVAQLCFLVDEAVYDAARHKEVELLIQIWQIGGVLFHKGEYRRQAYLIERYQEISKTPLLLANDFQHGLSFYLQGDSLPDNPASKEHYCDLGKAVMAQNRRMGVQVQFDRDRGSERSLMNEENSKAFRRGIRSGHGIVAKEQSALQQESYPYSSRTGFSIFSLKDKPQLTSLFSQYQVQETVGFKTLTFFDATSLEENDLEEQLLKAFKQLYDVILLGKNISSAITTLTHLVNTGKISEAALDRHIMKVLIIKSMYS